MKLIGLVNSCRLYPVYEHVWSNSKQNVEVSETWGVRLRVLVIKIHIVSNLNLYGKSPRRHQHKGNENIQTGVRHAQNQQHNQNVEEITHRNTGPHIGPLIMCITINEVRVFRS